VRGAGVVPRSLTLEGLAGYTTTVQFADKGLVLVTGQNGAGKSLLFIDAIAWALFGESPRGKNPEGVVKLETASGLSCQRKRVKSGASSLTFSATQYETTSKAQEALEAIVGDYEAWYRASVFTSQEAGVFSRVPDKARKALIEQAIPGFDRFDEALKRCRADLAKAQGARSSLTHDLMFAEGELRAAQQRLKDVDAQLAEAGPDEAQDHGEKTKRLGEVLAKRKSLAAQIEKLRDQIDEMREPALSSSEQETLTELETDLRVAKRKLDATKSGHCPTCSQSVDGLRDSWARSATETVEKLDANRTRFEEKLAERCREHVNLLTARRAYLRELQGIDNEHESEERELRDLVAGQGQRLIERKRLTERRKSAQAAILEQEERLAPIREAEKRAKVRLAELTAAEQVLAPRGVRAALLRRTTAALHELTNVYLSRFWPGVGVELTIDEEKQTVTLLMTGHKHTDPAKLSNGELRRIDCALFFARRDLLMAAYGVPTSMVVLDEALDGFDPDGVEAVGGFLAELAETQPVVVISHAEGV
jgi:DNA repair exonuclease SbcCD ATPase subunit